MSFLRQFLVGASVFGVVVFIWVRHVPEAIPFLERVGILAVLGVDASASAEQVSDGPRRSSGPVLVIVADVEARTQADEVTAIGDGRALRSVTVRSEAVGKITEISLNAGNRVEASDVIVQLEDEAETIAMERARITLDDAIAEAERVGRLESTGAVTEVRAREAELALRSAELNLRQAELDLERRRIIAPISGWVGIIDVEVGDRVAAQESIASITDRSSILIDFRIPERVIGNTSIGMPVRLMPLGLRDLALQGEISAIDTVVDRASRTMRVQARVDNSDDLLRVGMAFEVSLSFPGETLLSVDPLSVQWASDGAFVWAVRRDKAERVSVTIRQRNSDQVLIEGDLEPGEPIVTEGVQELRPGSEVVISGSGEARSASLPATKS